MASARKLNELAQQKRLLVAQADLHRQLLALDIARIGAARRRAGAFVERNRWWLLGGAAAVGLVAGRRQRGMLAWLPTLLAAARSFIR